jgi:mannitol-1-phosphate/altronate dehydrogenase
MKRRTALFAALVLAASPAFADQKVDHYAAEPSDDLAQALTNFRDYNARMAAILAKDTLNGDDLEDIHQLTYTIETALARIIAEARDLADALERVHEASEGGSAEYLRAQAAPYLTVAQQLVP